MARNRCTVGDCDELVVGRGMCRLHYSRWHRGSDVHHGRGHNYPPGTACSVPTCAQPVYARGWCRFHWTRWSERGTLDDPIIPTAEQRFWPKVDKNGPIPEYAPQLGPCWLWKSGLNVGGYGAFQVGRGKRAAHRFSYELLVGPIPVGLQLDHLCRVTACVNPAHLEPVTCRENLLRGETWQARNAAKTHCPQGHPYDAANTVTEISGSRSCRTCRNERKRAKRAAA